MKDKTSDILVVDDDANIRKTFGKILKLKGYNIESAETGSEAISYAKSKFFNIVFIDVRLPDASGLEVLKAIQEINEDTAAIMITAYASIDSSIEAMNQGAYSYITKPVNMDQVLVVMDRALDKQQLSMENKRLLKELMRDQDELREKNRQLEELAITDPLTELFNMRHFDTILENEFNRSIRYQSPTSCLMIDIDYFKKINDEYGHATGDMVLKELAKLIKSCARETDTVARLGGEEFIVLLPETKKEGALQTAKRILEAISHHQFSNISRQITVSIGTASVPEASIDTAEKLIRASDFALYEAKAKGRNRIEGLVY